MSLSTLNGSPCCCISLDLGLASADTAVIELRPGMATAPTSGDLVTLACDGTVLLYGTARTSRIVSGSADATRVTVEGPWAALESLVYQQTQKFAVPTSGGGTTLTNILTPEIQLGMADDGTLRTTLQEATAIIAYAAAAGVSISLAATFTGLTIPIIEGNGLTCASALMALLDYHPDVVPYFAYSSSAAVLTLKPMGSLTTVTLPGTGKRVLSAAFRPVRDYRPNGVRILYTRTGSSGLKEASTDSAGTIGTQGKYPKVINAVLPLEGSDPPPTQEQQIRTRPIPNNTETEGKKTFWKSHLPWLQETGALASVIITEHTLTVDAPNVESDTTGEVVNTWSTDPADYPSELVDGTVQPWMSRRTAPVTVSAKFAWSGGTLTDKLKAVFGETGLDTKVFDVKVTGTNARTRIYRALGTSGTIPDFPSAGLAASYLAGFSAAVFEGTISLTGAVQPIHFPGRKINVTGFADAWTTMAAIAQNVSYDPQAHTVTITCGAPRSLSFSDFRELQNNLKKRRLLSASAAYARRTQAMSGNGEKVTGAERSPSRSVTSPGGSGSTVARPLQTVAKVNSDGTRQIGITYGNFMGAYFSLVPTIAGTALSLATTWFSTAIANSDTAERFVYAKLTIDDTEPLDGKITAVELSLRTTHPSPRFSPSSYQYLHLGSVLMDGTPAPTQHTNGSLFLARNGGPGCFYYPYTP